MPQLHEKATQYSEIKHKDRIKLNPLPEKKKIMKISQYLK